MANDSDGLHGQGAPDAGPAESGIGGLPHAVLAQSAYVLQPLVRLLVQHGVTYPQLAEVLKGLFVDAASAMAHDAGERITDSKISVATGIHRKDVKRLRGAGDGQARELPQALAPSIPSVIATHWLSDPRFRDAGGQLKPMQRHGNGAGSFDELVRGLYTDVHPRTVLNELLRLELVTTDDETVRLKGDAFVPNPDLTQMLEFFGANLHDHAAAAVHNMLKRAPPFLEQSIFSDEVAAAAIPALAALARAEWAQMLKRVVPEVARVEVDPAMRKDIGEQQVRRMRIGMYFYADGTNEAQSGAAPGNHHDES